MASCAETELRRLESDLQNLVLTAGLSLTQCNVIRPKGNCYVLFRYDYASQLLIFSDSLAWSPPGQYERSFTSVVELYL